MGQAGLLIAGLLVAVAGWRSEAPTPRAAAHATGTRPAGKLPAWRTAGGGEGSAAALAELPFGLGQQGDDVLAELHITTVAGQPGSDVAHQFGESGPQRHHR